MVALGARSPPRVAPRGSPAPARGHAVEIASARSAPRPISGRPLERELAAIISLAAHQLAEHAARVRGARRVWSRTPLQQLLEVLGRVDVERERRHRDHLRRRALLRPRDRCAAGGCPRRRRVSSRSAASAAARWFPRHDGRARSAPSARRPGCAISSSSSAGSSSGQSPGTSSARVGAIAQRSRIPSLRGLAVARGSCPRSRRAVSGGDLRGDPVGRDHDRSGRSTAPRAAPAAHRRTSPRPARAGRRAGRRATGAAWRRRISSPGRIATVLIRRGNLLGTGRVPGKASD